MTFEKDKYDRRIEFRVTEEQGKLIDELARDCGLSVADFIRHCIQTTANGGG